MTGVGSEITFFAAEDREEALQLIRSLCTGKDDGASLDAQRNVEQLGKILSKYQEQSTLLDPHLEELVKPIMITIRDEMRNCPALSDTNASLASATFQRIQLISIHPLCSAIRQFCRVRGSKHIINHMPHEVQDLEICLRLLQAQVSLRCLNASPSVT